MKGSKIVHHFCLTTYSSYHEQNIKSILGIVYFLIKRLCTVITIYSVFDFNFYECWQSFGSAYNFIVNVNMVVYIFGHQVIVTIIDKLIISHKLAPLHMFTGTIAGIGASVGNYNKWFKIFVCYIL